MIVRFNILGYLIKEGFRNVFKNKKSTISSLTIMCATMLVFGIFFLIGENVNYIINTVEQAQGLEVFMKNDATEDEIDTVERQIRENIPEINTLTRITKEEALNRLKERFKDQAYMLDMYEENNILPASFIITLTDLSKTEEVREEILTFDNVKRIESSDQTISTLLKIANGIRIGTGIFLLFLIVISVFIISNTIKLSVHSRRKEISIMKYVGATNSFIRWPFIIEGIIIGVVAALLSIIIIGLLYNLVAGQIMESSVVALINISLLSFSEMFNLIICVYMGLGIGVGVLGSAISMRKYLEV